VVATVTAPAAVTTLICETCPPLEVITPEIVGDVIDGEVKVLFVKVSVVALPTRVSVEVGSVNVPVFVIKEITGDVNVLLVNV
jgi:hypothetical protein